MRNSFLWALFLGSLLLGTVVAQDCSDFVAGVVISPNPFFESEVGWIEDTTDGGDAEFTYNTADGLFIEVIEPGPNGHNVALRADVDVVAGTDYQITLVARAELGQSRNVRIVTDGGADQGFDADSYCGRTVVTLTDEFQTFNICCTPSNTSPIRFILEFGGAFTNATDELFVSQFQMAAAQVVPSSSVSSSEEPTVSSSVAEDTTSTPGSTTVDPPSDCELYFVPAEVISPSPFLDSAEGWIEDANEGGQAIFTYNTTDGLFIDVINPGPNGYNVALRADVDVVAGTEYRITLVAKTEPERTRDVQIVTDGGESQDYDVDNYCGRTVVTLTDEFQTFTICCTPVNTSPIRFILEFGGSFVNPTFDLFVSQFQMASGQLVLPSSTISSTVAPTGTLTTESTTTTSPSQTDVENPTSLPEISSEDPGISGGALAAIIIVIIAVILAVIIAVVLFWKFRDSDEDSSKSEELQNVKGVAVQGEAETESSSESESESETGSGSGSGSSESESASTSSKS